MSEAQRFFTSCQLCAFVLGMSALVAPLQAQSGADACPAEDLGTLSGPGALNPIALAMTFDDFSQPSAAQCPLPCGDWGFGNDVIYTFQVDQATNWVFEICAPVDQFFGGSMQLRSGGACPGDTCIDADDGGCTSCLPNPVGPGLELVASLTPGTQYWLIVDAKIPYDPKNSPGTGGIWNLTYDIAAGGCGDGVLDPGEACDPPDGLTCDATCQILPGHTCKDSIVIDLNTQLPLMDLNTTCNREDNYNSGTCISGVPVPPGTANYTAGEDIIYELITATDMCLNIDVQGDIAGFCDFIGFALDDACPPELNCLAAQANGCEIEEPLEFIDLPAGTYWLLIDNWAPPSCIPQFTLSLSECPTAGACCVGEACKDGVDGDACTGRSFLGQTCEDIEICPPDNDLCTDATSIGEGITNFDTAGATADPNGGNSCTFPLQEEVWYHYTATFTGAALIDTCGPSGDDGPDTIMEIYAGCDCPPSGSTLECVNDTENCGAGGLSSRAVINVIDGSCFTIRMSGFLDNSAAGELSIEPYVCDNFAECGDNLPADSLRDDACAWYACDAGFCADIPRSTQGDIGGGNGACLIDGACDGNDRFHALNCFSNTTTQGNSGYPCEPFPPSAINVDAGGPGISCDLDGVCDGNDAFHALNCFSDVNSEGLAPYPCSCIGPQPVFEGPQLPSQKPASAVTLRGPRHAVAPGAYVDVDVYLDHSLEALRGYQLHVGVRAGDRGALELVDMTVDRAREDYVFGDDIVTWSAFNRDSAQMVVGMDAGGGQPAAAGAYLATFRYRVTPQASGTFIVDLRYEPDPRPTTGERSFLFGRHAAPLDIRHIQPATIVVAAVPGDRTRTRDRIQP